MKKLPSIYANKIEKNKENNESIYKSYKQEEKIKQEKKDYPQITIDQKIKKIMNKKKYSYKIPVKITTKEKTIEKEIIGKNKKNLITIDNELIKIEDIIKIEEK